MSQSPRERTLIGRLAINDRWKNAEVAEEIRRELRAIKAQKLMDQAYALLRANAEDDSK